MIYLSPDPQHETVAFFAAHFVSQPGIAALAHYLGCHPRIAARIAAERVYMAGYRTTLLGDGLRITHHVNSPIGPLDPDPPGPGIRGDIAA